MSFAKHIVVATDFSEHASRALDLAASLARQTDAAVTLVHVFDPTPLGPNPISAESTSAQIGHEAEVETTIHKALDEDAERFEGIRSGTALVLSHSAAHGICDYAVKHRADLIVMGTHGRSGLEHLLLGSVAERVLRLAKCPVLAVPAPEQDSSQA